MKPIDVTKLTQDDVGRILWTVWEMWVDPCDVVSGEEKIDLSDCAIKFVVGWNEATNEPIFTELLIDQKGAHPDDQLKSAWYPLDRVREWRFFDTIPEAIEDFLEDEHITAHAKLKAVELAREVLTRTRMCGK